MDDLVDSGVQIVNLQDLVNGLEWIRHRFKGKVCIDLDIDRQNITRFGTPEEVDALIRTEVETLGSREGGLMMIYGMYPGIPLANAKALMDAMESKLAVCEKELQDLSAENGMIRQGLAAATDVRDSYKNKLRSQQQAVKESRTVIQDLEKRLRKTEQARALECELLDNFRKLAIHTG